MITKTPLVGRGGIKRKSKKKKKKKKKKEKEKKRMVLNHLDKTVIFLLDSKSPGGATLTRGSINLL